MGDAVDPSELARLRARAAWTRPRADTDSDAEVCAHREVVMEPGEVPRCGRCGESLSPDALRRAGVKGRRA